MAIRSARSEQDLIPVGPERRRLRNLLVIWFVIIPVLVVLFDLLSRLVARLLSIEELRLIADTALGELNTGAFGVPNFIYFGPVALSGFALLLALGLVVLDHFRQLRTVQTVGYFITAMAVFLVLVNNALVMFWVAGTNQQWLWVIAFACFLSAAGGSAIYLVINFITNATRSLADYGVSIAVFAVSTVVVFSLVLGTDAVGEYLADRESAKTEAVEGTGGDGSQAMGLDNGVQQSAVQGTVGVGDENDNDETQSADAGSQGNDWWVLTRFFLLVAVPAVATMWMYHSFQRWRLNGRIHETQLGKLAYKVMDNLGRHEKAQRKKLCKKIGKRLSSNLSRAQTLEYSVYICQASHGSGRELSNAALRVDLGVSEAAISAGIQAVIDWVDQPKRGWPSSTYQFLYIRVSGGIASQLYCREVDRGRRWPFIVDADILACSRMLAVLVTDAMYRAKLHRSVSLRCRPSERG